VSTLSAPVTYIANLVPNPDEVFARLRDELAWERRDTTPRSEYYCNDSPKPYIYGRERGRRLYEPRPYHPIVLAIRKDLEARTGAVLDVCFLNMYRDQTDQLGWHADDSPEMDDARPIVTVSLGAEREIWFRPNGSPKPVGGAPDPSVERLLLGHGSAAIMAPGMQDHWQHRIPKGSRSCGARISLTYRGYVGGERSELPPRLRNWKKGTPQIGAFLRTRDGSTITLVDDSANEKQETLLLALILGSQKIPEEIMGALRTWVDTQVRR
jgi:alkylated DNA repair dioxygenase AlkB